MNELCVNPSLTEDHQDTPLIQEMLFLEDHQETPLNLHLFFVRSIYKDLHLHVHDGIYTQGRMVNNLVYIIGPISLTVSVFEASVYITVRAKR